MGTHIKKPKEIMIADSHLEAYQNNTYLIKSCLWQDATSSVIQNIGCLTKNRKLCKYSNLIGNDYVDLYNKNVALVIADIKKIDKNEVPITISTS